jgi:hypothetical protein
MLYVGKASRYWLIFSYHGASKFLHPLRNERIEVSSIFSNVMGRPLMTMATEEIPSHLETVYSKPLGLAHILYR